MKSEMRLPAFSSAMIMRFSMSVSLIFISSWNLSNCGLIIMLGVASSKMSVQTSDTLVRIVSI